MDNDPPIWLYRGVPIESPEVFDVRATGEVAPPRSDRSGEYWRRLHVFVAQTDTNYTSWTSDRSIAVDAAESMSADRGLSGRISVFRVRFDCLDPDSVYDGRGDEFEYLIEGIVEGVQFSVQEEDEDETADE